MTAREKIRLAYVIVVRDVYGTYSVEFTARGLKPYSVGNIVPLGPRALVFPTASGFRVEWSILPDDRKATLRDFEEVAKAKVREAIRQRRR